MSILLLSYIIIDDFVPIAEILRANDDLTKVIEDYRRIVGVPEEPRTTESSSSTAQSAPVKTSEHSSNLSSLIDLDISGTQAPSTANGSMLSNDLQDLGRSRYRISVL